MSKVSSEAKSCMVCGDRALGHNFNAVTCESCKAFFRRNAISSKKFTCPFSNSCEINTITRRFCQRCRLEKCFRVGMKKEYIMSEEDKELKRIKIEQNRNKRKLKSSVEKTSSSSEDQDQTIVTKKSIKVKEEWSPGSSAMDISDNSMNLDSVEPVKPKVELTSDSTPAEILEAISSDSKNSSQVINQVMKTQSDAVKVMTGLIEDPAQALILISHLIKNPADAMLIISKMMSSPLDALSVFTQFMASPTDSLQMIFKIMSSPKDVIQFMSDLAKEPQQAWEVMKRFRANKTDSLQGLNQVMLRSMSVESAAQSPEPVDMIKSMLDGSSAGSPGSSSSINSPSSAFHSTGTPYSPQVVPFSPPDYDSNNNDYQQETDKLLNEICEDMKNSPLQNGSIDSIISEAIKLEYETPEMACHMKSASRDLNNVEIAKIQELLDSNKALYAPVDEDIKALMFGEGIKAEPGVDPMLLRVINLTAIAIRRLIKMSKKISGFKKMCQEDQIALLKGGCTEMLLMRSVMQYDAEHDFWKVPHTMASANIKADILKLCPKGKLYEEHENFIKTFDPKLRSDENIVLILCAITLFCPERQNIIHPDVIKLEQNSYFFLLRRYLESVYDGCEARSIFLQLLRKIQEVRKLNEDVISVYLDANPSQVEPLLREIFDLKV